MIVVDANVLVHALVSPTADGDVARAALVDDDQWLAPAHMPLEVLHTISKAAVRHRIDLADADAAFRALTSMQIDSIDIDRALLTLAWSMRHNVSVYDAAYLAVAATHDAPLVTFDARLGEAAKHAKVAVDVTVL